VRPLSVLWNSCFLSVCFGVCSVCCLWIGGKSPTWGACACLQAWETFQWFCWNKFLPSNMGLYFARTIVVLVPPRFVMQNRAFFYWHELFSICPFSCQLRYQQWCVHNADSYYMVFCCNYAVLVERCIIVGPGHMTTSPAVVDNLIFHQWRFPGPQEICVALMVKLNLQDSLHGKSLPSHAKETSHVSLLRFHSFRGWTC